MIEALFVAVAACAAYAEDQNLEIAPKLSEAKDCLTALGVTAGELEITPIEDATAFGVALQNLANPLTLQNVFEAPKDTTLIVNGAIYDAFIARFLTNIVLANNAYSA